MWHTGAGYEISMEEIFKVIIKHTKNNGSVFVGCDSHVIKNQCIFSTAICLHGAEGQRGGRYFYKRDKLQSKNFPSMLMRLTKEVEKSIEIASTISEYDEKIHIEIHIDASSRKEGQTHKFADMLMGYAKGAGFDCKVKPEAWASNSIADKHSK